MKRLYTLALALMLVGCAGTQPGPQWITVDASDRFMDESTCGVTTAAFYSDSRLFTLHYFPYIEKIRGVLLVGMRTRALLSAPVGLVQIQIDQLPAWTISPLETPVKSVPEKRPSWAGLGTGSKELDEGLWQIMTRQSSPFALATGEKAENILAQLKSGAVLRYQSFRDGSASTPSGEYVLDDSLEKALAECGIE
ncbi:hypothetical protein [Pseudomonas cremoricolorata]|uniref:Lipoprotein n=1 Tax=Pseudomonas cremoricolorata TaxID=157783 RepID=A0A089YAK0_9PSED|nr:hypothetical protein [Pseudomonas cremoricolorata]AIR88853.1 hypothetical protein LK03_06045 [Pseudomonas cremoricolorata]